VSRHQRPIGFMVYGSPEGPGRFVPAPGRIARIRSRLGPWAGKTAMTNGEMVLFCTGWALAGVVSLFIGGHNVWLAAVIAICVTLLAAVSHVAAARVRRSR